MAVFTLARHSSFSFKELGASLALLCVCIGSGRSARRDGILRRLSAIPGCLSLLVLLVHWRYKLLIRIRTKMNKAQFQSLSNRLLPPDVIPGQKVDRIEAVVAKKEQMMQPSVTEGAEKKVFWAEGKEGQQTDVCVVYMHGLRACRQESSPTFEEMTSAIGANGFFTRLTGHGLGKRMVPCSWEDWRNDAIEAFLIGALLGKKVVFVACSFGAPFVLWLASQSWTHDKIQGIILCSPCLGVWMPSWVAYLLSVEFPLRKFLYSKGPDELTDPSQVVNELHGKYWCLEVPFKAFASFWASMQLVATINPKKIMVPVLVIASPKDSGVPFPATKYYFERFGSPCKKLHLVENSDDSANHVLTGRIRSPSTTEAVRDVAIAFAKEHF